MLDICDWRYYLMGRDVANLIMRGCNLIDNLYMLKRRLNWVFFGRFESLINIDRSSIYLLIDNSTHAKNDTVISILNTTFKINYNWIIIYNSVQKTLGCISRFQSTCLHYFTTAEINTGLYNEDNALIITDESIIKNLLIVCKTCTLLWNLVIFK